MRESRPRVSARKRLASSTTGASILATTDWSAEPAEDGGDPVPRDTTRIHLLPRTEAAREFIVQRSEQPGGFVHSSIVRVLVGEEEWVVALQLPQDRLTFFEVRNNAIVGSATVDH